MITCDHDQGLIPVKLAGRVRPRRQRYAGLPIIRTAVDHESAFDIAGRGMASIDSLVAVAVAARSTSASVAPARS